MQRRQGLKNGTREPDPKKVPKPIARVTKPIPKRSEKMKGIISALRPLYDRFLKDHPDCEIGSEVCTGQATEVHHAEGRGVKVILDDAKWKAACHDCHMRLERKDQEAREKGNKVSKHTK